MRRVTLFLVSLIIWYLLTWPYDFRSRTMDWQFLIAGLAFSLLAALLFAKLLTPYPRIFTRPSRYLWFLLYLPIFFYYMLLANLDVVYRVLHPKMPIHPGIVKVKTSLKSAAGRTALANSITLTPGTLTVDITDEGYLYVHWINVKKEDTQGATKEIVARFEKILAKIFE